MRIRGKWSDWKNSDFFQKYSKKLDKTNKISKKFILNTLRLAFVINKLTKAYIGTKWGLRHVFVFFVNGFFLYLFIYGTRHPNIIIKVFSLGAALWFISRIIRPIWIVYVQYKHSVSGKKLQSSEVSEWQKYKNNEYKKRGIS